MAYVPTEWKTGDIVTAAKLNKLEEGVASAGMYIIEYSADTFPSFNDIINAVKDGKTVVAMDVDGDIVDLYYFNGSWYDSERALYLVDFHNTAGGEFNRFRLSSSTKTDPMIED